MTDAEIDLLRRRATGFRRAIERAKVEYEYAADAGRLTTWPKDCCDSPLFMIFLDECGYDPVRRHSGDITHYGEDSAREHHWYEIDGVLVDITADQFDDMRGQQVIVVRHSPWHAALTPAKETPKELTVRQYLVRLRERRIDSFDNDYERAIMPYYELG